MYYAYKGKIPPKEWEHDNILTDEDGNTVAMNLAHHNAIAHK